ncbi:MAG TPA: four helix bundle protein [Bacteroidia bacterium]|nr:four helix bundle protein [Bacteroidia bacterium]
MNRFKELLVWQKAIELAAEVYQLTKSFPSDERYGIVSQMNRCSISIPSNIAEGSGRNSKKEFLHFLGIASGSASELETQLIISKKLKFGDIIQINALIDKITSIQNMLFRLKNTLK